MSELSIEQFPDFFRALYGNNREPFPWQTMLVKRVVEKGWPNLLDLPTASGKTACIDIAVFALAVQSHLDWQHRTTPKWYSLSSIGGSWWMRHTNVRNSSPTRCLLPIRKSLAKWRNVSKVFRAPVYPSPPPAFGVVWCPTTAGQTSLHNRPSSPARSIK